MEINDWMRIQALSVPLVFKYTAVGYLSQYRTVTLSY
jgi:hypothetical protein